MINITLFNMYKNEDKINLSRVSEEDIINTIAHEPVMGSEIMIRDQVIYRLLDNDEDSIRRMAKYTSGRPEAYLILLDVIRAIDRESHDKYVAMICKITSVYGKSVPIVTESRINASVLSSQNKTVVCEQVRINRLIY